MRKLGAGSLLAVVVTLALSGLACSSNGSGTSSGAGTTSTGAAPAAAKPRVAVSLFPLYDVARSFR